MKQRLSSDPGDGVVYPAPLEKPASVGWLTATIPYIQIARPDHWFKNVFMLAGVVVAYFYEMAPLTPQQVWLIPLALAATCLIASSNYVINEVLDARSDRGHPTKRNRPIPSGRVKLPLAYLEWAGLGAVGLLLAAQVNFSFLLAAVALLVMGMAYNIPPVRTKEVPYLDVLSESVNNPIRLMLGWFTITATLLPPMSLILSYWMIGAFFMASKRFAEYRQINDKAIASAYRRSFAYYDDNRLLVSMFFYASGAALLLGVFIIRYHLELILSVPLIAGFFSAYMHVALKENSAVQNPEHLYRETGLMVYLVITVFAFLGLMFVSVPGLYEIFNVAPSRVPSLWSWD
ncbi:UbiA prenyltransferase family protein [Candidatus Laterigemmans baculatus]|uniref:UbiA prenyltransferase family protein n=1 Tax=Candidatus Laterigemmans baculatus TaxID=2770505 RepID=UPI0013D8EDC4|nr:UbiA prenyltransferase family protein [Candidatus Laterigemmans baculatus]